MHQLINELLVMCIYDYEFGIPEIIELPENFTKIIYEIKQTHIGIELPSKIDIFKFINENKYFQRIQTNSGSGQKTYAIYSLVNECMSQINYKMNNRKKLFVKFIF